MITGEQLVDRFGKDKAVQMMVHSAKNGQTGADKDRGIRGRIKYKLCEHGIWVIENYKSGKPCADCVPMVETKSKDFRPGFNIGLGCWVESRSEEKKIAKSLGLVERG